jgi:hypothetical protein
MNQRHSRAAVNRPSPHDAETFGQVLPFRPPRARAPIRPAERFPPDAGLAGHWAGELAAGIDGDLARDGLARDGLARDDLAKDDLARDDLAIYERERDDLEEVEEVVDYRQRMVMNFIALAVVAFLVGAGVWLADTIADMQRDQDCIMQGRANCAPLELPMPAQP